MSEESGLGWPATGEPSRPQSANVDASAEMLGIHAAHLYDYCRALFGREDEAASTAQSALDSAQSLLHDPDRLRAWLFALARRQAVALSPGSADELDYTPSAQLPAFTLNDLVTTDPGPGASRRPGDAVLPAFRALANRDREILDLVYRHGIRPEDLPAVLGVPPEEAARQLAAAEEEFSELTALRQRDETAAGGDPGLDDIAGLPLAELPESVSSTATAGRSAGSRLAWLARWREWLTAAVAVPVAAVGIALVYLAGPGHTVGSSSPAARPPSGGPTPAVQSATSTPSPATSPPKRRASPGPSVAAVVPAALPGASQRPPSPTTRPKASPKPSPTPSASPSPSVTVSPSPTPSSPPTGSPSPTSSATGSP